MEEKVFHNCNPIFVVGASRSGTTLLQLMLNAHPNIAIYGELHYFDEILQIKKLLPSLKTDEDIDRFFLMLRNVYSYRHLPHSEKVYNAVKLRMKNDNSCSYEKFYKFSLEENAAINHSERIGEKTPENIRYLKKLITIFPNCKIIHIVRDPRAVIASCIKVPWTSNSTIINALKWKSEVNNSQVFLRSNPSVSYLEVLYEKLVSTPQNELKRICRFMGEGYDQKMLDYYKLSDRNLRNEPWKNGTKRPIYGSSTQRWRNELSAAQIFIIEKTVSSFMRKFGYERSTINISTKLNSITVLWLEFVRYLQYKFKERTSDKTEGENVITPEQRTLYKIVFKCLLGMPLTNKVF